MPTSSGFAGVAWAEGKEEKNNKKKEWEKKKVERERRKDAHQKRNGKERELLL